MTRIISGEWGGRRLAVPKGDSTRPTTDRVREAVFSSLESHFGSLNGLRILDAYAGTGALGLEAMSRGAAVADFVEKDSKASTTLLANIKTLGAANRGRVHRTTAAAFVRGRSGDQSLWDVVFLDPPYDVPTSELSELIVALDPLVSPDGLFVVERSARSGFSWPDPVEPLREKKYGETQIWYGR